MNQDKTYWPVEKLQNWEKNPRAIKKEDFERLKRQIKKFGQYKPLLITPDGTVLGGNMRLRAYRDLKVEQIWVSIVEPKTEAEKLEYALSDNDRAGYYVEDQLGELITEYGLEISLDDYTVDLGEALTLTDVLNKFGPDPNEDEAPPLAEGEPVSKLGEVYQLGTHRLMCGDATKAEDIKKLLNVSKPVMLFTDPPYGVDYLSRQPKKTWGKIINDNLENDEMFKLLKDSCSPYLKNAYICCNWKCYTDFEIALGKPRNLIVWDKGSVGLGWGYRYQHEFVLFYGEIKKIGSETDVWEVKRDPTINYTHPTQKPVGLAARAIRNSSKPNEVVLDLFGGSGSTLIACEQLNRRCFVMELDPKYCDVIRKRYAKTIRKEAEWIASTPLLHSEDHYSIKDTHETTPTPGVEERSNHDQNPKGAIA